MVSGKVEDQKSDWSAFEAGWDCSARQQCSTRVRSRFTKNSRHEDDHRKCEKRTKRAWCMR